MQIGLIYTNPAMQIANGTTTGIRIFFSSGFVQANPRILDVANRDINGLTSGFITLDMYPGATPVEGDFIRIEGVRGMIDLSIASTPGTDLFVDLQSINDPTANSFTPDRVRVAKSLDGMNVAISSDSLLLCFPTLGKPPGGSPSYYITITEGFARAFVDNDANNDSLLINDRVDSGGPYTSSTGTTPPFTANPATSSLLGAPTNSTQFTVWLDRIPTSVSGIIWDSSVGGTSQLVLVPGSTTFDSTTGMATARYSFETSNQTGYSDITFESFTLRPLVVLKSTAQTATGQVLAGVTLAPGESTTNRPRFKTMYESDNVATNNPPDDPLRLYANVIRCNCFLLFTYVTAGAGFNTGMVIANTSGDTAPFGVNEAADQLGKVTFYFYDKSAGYVGSTVTTDDVLAGKSFVGLVSQILPSGVTSFSGYIIAKAEFQFCHGFAFIADDKFAGIAHGYIANVMPDPAILNIGGRRAAIAASDTVNKLPAGESLNN
ncbi:MAG: hypothetical protein FJW35_03075 [Acidobacteria bacterium]|nr:hypothetical protein [Acidobacteriota bacterium]